jgi:hypothetical protein
MGMTEYTRGEIPTDRRPRGRVTGDVFGWALIALILGVIVLAFVA